MPQHPDLPLLGVLLGIMQSKGKICMSNNEKSTGTSVISSVHSSKRLLCNVLRIRMRRLLVKGNSLTPKNAMVASKEGDSCFWAQHLSGSQ